MKVREVRAELARKTLEFRQASKEGQPDTELRRLYRELKVWQYRLLEAEIEEKVKHAVTEMSDTSI